MIIFGPCSSSPASAFSAGCCSRSPSSRSPSMPALTVGIWAFHTGAGWLGGAIVGVIAAGADIWRRAIGARLRSLDLAPARHRARLCCAGDGRRLLRHARNRPDGYAVRDMADRFFRSSARSQSASPLWSAIGGTALPGREEARVSRGPDAIAAAPVGERSICISPSSSS